jgi:hypothetical protein
VGATAITSILLPKASFICSTALRKNYGNEARQINYTIADMIICLKALTLPHSHAQGETN